MSSQVGNARVGASSARAARAAATARAAGAATTARLHASGPREGVVRGASAGTGHSHGQVARA